MTFKALITTLTPIHIGNGVKYQHKVEFFTEKDKNNKDWVYIIDPNKILKLIGIDGINEWTKSIESGVPIKEFLKNRKFDTNSIVKKKCPLANPIKKDKELHEQVFNPILGPYIPGSSLKGAIKTAILDNISDNIDRISSLNLSDIRIEKINNNRKEVKWDFYEKADLKLFGEGANYKTTRFLKVGDAYFTNTQIKVYFTQALNAEDNADGGKWRLNGAISNLYEAIPQGSMTIFQFSIDEQLLKLNKDKNSENWNSVDTSFLSRGLFKIINDSSKRAIEREIELLNSIELDSAGAQLKTEYEKIKSEIERLSDNEFIIRVGANSGYNFMTLRWIDKLPFFQPIDNNRGYFELRKVIQKNKKHKEYKNEKNWPRTRKIVTTGIPFGFVKIKILTDDEYIKLKDELKENKQIYTNKSKSEKNTLTSQSNFQAHPFIHPIIPQPYKGKIIQGQTVVPAIVVKSGRPNIVQLLIEGENVQLCLNGYASEIKEGNYIFVKVDEFSKNKIRKVSFKKFHY